MVLIYHFKKEKVAGRVIRRPKIDVCLNVGTNYVDVPALLDTGCDVTVIPYKIAEILGLPTDGKRHLLFAYQESHMVIENVVDMTFTGRAGREAVTLRNVPILITQKEDGSAEENEIVLGLQKIFDEFGITFKRAIDRIEMKKVGV